MIARTSNFKTALTIFVLVAPFFAAGQDKAATPATGPVAQATDSHDSTPEVSSRNAVIVREFTISEKTSWPYELKQLQSQTVAELKAKANNTDVLVGPPATPRTHTYTLEGEIVSWRAGNAAKRWVVGMGSGREAADIHYWLTDEQGKRVFEHKDTIRAEFWGNAYAGSVGQLAHPFASKIAARLTEAKVF
jgi:Domain of unknown function (DUF4410)